ncbi:MAG: mannose-1-phosphate guanylyltransferase [Anaerolineae bacterium]
MFHALIMAGGIGTRLWPLSRRANPKQLLRLVDDASMFEHAVARLSPLVPIEQIHVVARADLIDALWAQVPALPRTNFIVEPEGRGTAPAIGLGAIHLLKEDPDAVMAVLTADHHIADVPAFQRALSVAEALAQEGHLVTMGIQPSFPSTGYGYIEQGAATKVVRGLQAYEVEAFTEKPDADRATKMVTSGDYAWNSGMFIWRADRILAEFARQMPRFHEQLAEIADALGTADYEPVLARLWPQVDKQTIDYGIMEGAKDVVVLPVEIGWSDVGSWASVFDVRPPDEDGNILLGEHMAINTTDTLVYGGDRLIATIGVDDLIIVDTPDALLVCRRGHEQDVKALVDRLRKDGREELL